ncbi:MAG: hypothetical protein JWN56_1149 [Sphingobacteriales bacterium]|nr:hypothetical protein [Sphingobacteriales bacterium]
MRYIKILIPTLVATSAMTLFSYLLSESADRNFKEPKLLGEIIKRNTPVKSPKKSQALGWIAHYLAGMAFISVYDKIWDKSSKKASVKSGLLLGGVSGLIGIIVWRSTLFVVPQPPYLPRLKFYTQLFPAHLIFGGFAAKTSRMIR